MLAMTCERIRMFECIFARMRTRTDKRHLAPQHVEQLGNLVDTQFPQQCTERSDALVVPRCLNNDRTVVKRGHRSELENLERPSIEADPRLKKKCRPRGLQTYRRRDHGDFAASRRDEPGRSDD